MPLIDLSRPFTGFWPFNPNSSVTCATKRRFTSEMKFLTVSAITQRSIIFINTNRVKKISLRYYHFIVV